MAENLERKITTEMLNDSYTGKGTYTLGSGSEYVGEFTDGYFHGKGTFTYKSGEKYVGELKKDKFNGRGTITYSNGNKYEGEWKDDKQNGKGVYTVANGPVITGDFINGLAEGYAVMDFLDGEKYEGKWVKNKKEGEGTYSWANGNKYVGEWKNGKQNGQGTYTYASGDKYVGEFKDDDKNGEGVFTWGFLSTASGDKYEGEWENDKQNGKGTYIWANGNKYEGEWENDKQNGEGTYIWANGNKYEGEWESDKQNGKGTYIWANGNKYEGEWENDKQNGKGTYTWADGSKYEGEWKDNLHNAKGVYIDEKNKKYSNISSIYLQSSELSNKILEHSNIKIDLNFKLDLLQDSSIKVDVLESMSRDKENYNSSILRKSIALHSKTPKSIISNLLEDDYRWVREAAASHSVINKQTVKKLMKTEDRYILKGLLVNPNTDKKDKDKISELIEDCPMEYDSYSINTYSYGIVEDVAGSVDIDSVVEAIISGEDDWSSYMYSEFYRYDDYCHNHLPTTLVDTVVFPDSSESGIYVEGKYLYPFVDISDERYQEGIGDDSFFHHAASHESGTWEYESFELEYEFQSKYLTAIFEDEAFTYGLILRYEYDNPENDDYIEEINGEFHESGGKGTDIELYVNTEDGVESCDDFCDIVSEMEEEGNNPEDAASVKKFLKKKYNLSIE